MYFFSFRKQALEDVKTKPQMLDKIVAGKVKKRISELCLMEQVMYITFVTIKPFYVI